MKFSIDKLQKVFIHTIEKQYTNKLISRMQLDECLLIIQLIEADFILMKPIQQSNDSDIVREHTASYNMVVTETLEEDEYEIDVEVYLQLLLKEIKQQKVNGKDKEIIEPLINLVQHYKRRWIDGDLSSSIN